MSVPVEQTMFDMPREEYAESVSKILDEQYSGLHKVLGLDEDVVTSIKENIVQLALNKYDGHYRTPREKFRARLRLTLNRHNADELFPEFVIDEVGTLALRKEIETFFMAMYDRLTTDKKVV